MTDFAEIINSDEAGLLQIFHKVNVEELPTDQKLGVLSKKLKLRSEQIVCAFGFNPNAPQLPEITHLLGFESFDNLASKRNDIYLTDTYKYLTLENVLNIYTAIKNDSKILQVMQYLLKKRLETIESRIEATVNSLLIEKYKAEMRSIYNDGIASIEFTEERLNRQDSGFRALLNEVAIIIESKIIPVGNIFFRDSILPEEKRKILNKGLISKELIESRLNDENIPQEEKKILRDYIKQSISNNN